MRFQTRKLRVSRAAFQGPDLGGLEGVNHETAQERVHLEKLRMDIEKGRAAADELTKKLADHQEATMTKALSLVCMLLVAMAEL